MQALILAGGSGTRFWPASRRQRPKQLLALEGETSLLQATVERLSPLVEPADVWICTTEVLAEQVREQLPEVPAEQVLVEPLGRNTAPAIGWSLSCMPEQVREGAVVVLPADHRVADPEAFRKVLGQAAEIALHQETVMTLGIAPRWAETGYGYLELGDALEIQNGPQGARAVAAFKEKPDAETAQRYLQGGRHLWNAGIFVFRGNLLLTHLERFEPELAGGLKEISAAPERTAELYPTLHSISIDYAVMERLGGGAIATLPLDCGWNDLGSWEALYDVLPADSDGNRLHGDAMVLDAANNLVYAERGTVAVLGVENLVVVQAGDSVLVLPRERSQEVRRFVDLLKEKERVDRL